MKILLAEDHHLVLADLRAQIENLDHKVITATDAGGALALLYPNGELNPTIDAVITDMRMGDGMTGLDILAYLKRRKNNLPCLLRSAAASYRGPGQPEIDLARTIKENFKFARFSLKNTMGQVESFLEAVSAQK